MHLRPQFVDALLTWVTTDLRILVALTEELCTCDHSLLMPLLIADVVKGVAFCVMGLNPTKIDDFLKAWTSYPGKFRRQCV